ncbi:MAG: M14 family metallopeptidase [Desmonostoc vinosum HA7617-LM4]|nr:M14 family metallopeptidase [Desmonostoc vinosum HA7617-LM4]
MSYVTAFSPNYATARYRFRTSAQALGCRLEAYPINQTGPDGEELTIDVAILGDPHPQKIVIVSSGLHGVEGFFGSAVQCALLEERLIGWSSIQGAALILLHTLNPYGFAWRRRWNEDNVDLNRNFLLPGEEYRGSAEKYRNLNAFFNPTSPPSRFEPFFLKAIASILRNGINDLKDTLPIGQYDFPQGLFFGGNSPSPTHQILAANLPQWLGNATDVLHIDFHTGLGKKATYKLFIDDLPNFESTEWLINIFGADAIETYKPGGTAYKIRGGLGTWCKTMFPQCNYKFLTAEFGTYPIIKVVEALRAENRAHFHSPPNDSSKEWTRQRLEEIFVPADRNWRHTVVSQGLDLVEQAIEVCFPPQEL